MPGGREKQRVVVPVLSSAAVSVLPSCETHFTSLCFTWNCGTAISLVRVSGGFSGRRLDGQLVRWCLFNNRRRKLSVACRRKIGPGEMGGGGPARSQSQDVISVQQGVSGMFVGLVYFLSLPTRFGDLLISVWKRNFCGSFPVANLLPLVLCAASQLVTCVLVTCLSTWYGVTVSVFWS